MTALAWESNMPLAPSGEIRIRFLRKRDLTGQTTRSQTGPGPGRGKGFLCVHTKLVRLQCVDTHQSVRSATSHDQGTIGSRAHPGAPACRLTGAGCKSCLTKTGGKKKEEEEEEEEGESVPRVQGTVLQRACQSLVRDCWI